MGTPISVIIPTHYRNDRLKNAIESVMEQAYEPVELIVVDDSGEAHAAPVLSSYDEVIAIYRETNGGWQAAYTTGIEASTGEYIQLLDDDDHLLPGKLAKTAEILDENPEVGVSYCGVIRGDDGAFYPKPEVSGDILESALRFQTFPLWTGSMLMRRSVLLDCLPLAGMATGDDLDIELGDTDLKIELAKRTKFDYVDECLVYYARDDNKLWTGDRRFKKVLQNVRHQQETYDRYPSVRAALLSNWYQRQGRTYLDEHIWSPRAIGCFIKAVYYANSPAARVRASIGTMAAVFGRPGWLFVEGVQDRLKSAR